MQAFCFWDASNTRPTVDVLLDPGISFEDLWAHAKIANIGGHAVRIWHDDHMKHFDPDKEPSAWGTYEDAEALRRWSFERRTPEQRLAWLQAALELAYQSGALKPRRPDDEAG